MGHLSPVVYLIVFVALLGIAYAVYLYKANQKEPETQTLGLVTALKTPTVDECFVDLDYTVKMLTQSFSLEEVTSDQQKHLKICKFCNGTFQSYLAKNPWLNSLKPSQ